MNYVEDLMDAQVASGDRVTYFFAGRHYPLLPEDRLRRWSRRGIRMREILNSSLMFAGATLTPEADLQHTPSERHLRAVLEEVSPDVVHIQEILGLPSSIIDVTKQAGIPVLATLQDYTPLCPTTKLYDVDGQICLRRNVGEQCTRCCAAAEPNHLLQRTLDYELRRRLPDHGRDRTMHALTRSARGLRRLAAVRRRPRGLPAPAGVAAQPVDGHGRGLSAAAYQARRDTNVERLARLDLLIAQSNRLKEIYVQLGVPADRLRVMQLTLNHLARLRPRSIAQPPAPVHFATLNGCVAVSKGSEVILTAIERLYEAGLGDQFRLTVWGGASGATRRRLERFASVRYAGEYDIAALDETLRSVDVGIIPSIWEEAYGYVGVEFLAKGIPVIGNRRGGIVDYTREGETGWVNTDASGEGLAAIIAKLIIDPTQVVEMHRRVIALRSTLIRSMPEHAREMNDVYRGLIALRGSPL